MIIKKKDRSYTTHKKYIQGKGFLDSLSSTLRNVGSYISQNKDLIAKPMLGAVGNLAAFGLTEVGKQQLSRLLTAKSERQSRLINKNNKAKTTELQALSPKDLEIIQNSLQALSLNDQNRLPNSLQALSLNEQSRVQTSGLNNGVVLPTTNIIGSGIKKF
jgi:hypothetical protein